MTTAIPATPPKRIWTRNHPKATCGTKGPADGGGKPKAWFFEEPAYRPEDSVTIRALDARLADIQKKSSTP